ncbi:MAG: hypothetical protein ABSB38_09845 [Dehalococcoidia bacterium]
MKTKTIGAICLLALASLGLLQACVEAHPSYEVLSFNMAPTKVATGEKVTVVAEVRNINSETDTYNIPLMVNGVADSRKSVTLAPGQSELLTFELTRSYAGGYKVSVGDKESTLTVQKPSPPDFRLSNLAINPDEVDVCQTTVITATLTNIGGSQGSYTAELKIDGVTNQTQKLNVPAGANCMLCFKVSKGLPGTYKVALGDLSGQFTVKEPPSPVFDIQITPPSPPCPPSDGGSCGYGG